MALPIRVIETRSRDLVWSSSRIIVWGRSENAQSLLTRWEQLCSAGNEDPKFNDEKLLLRAISQTGNLGLQTVPKAFAAWEITDAGPDSIIVHKTTRVNWLQVQRHALVEKIVGKPFAEWKYGIKHDR